MRRLGVICVFAVSCTTLFVACANGTADDGITDDPTTGDSSSPDSASDHSLVNPGDTSTFPGDSSMVTESGADTSPPVTSHVVINELRTASPEFCELYNPTSAAVSLSGWEVRYASSAGNAGTAGHKFGASDTIGPKSFLLLMNGTWTEGMAATDGQLGLFNAAGTGATKIDGIAYGNVTSGTLNYGEGAAGPGPSATGSIGRKTDGVDTDKNSADWTTFATPTPGAPN